MAKWGAHETHKQSFLPFVLQHNSWNDPVENYPFGNIRIVAKYCLYHKKIASLCLWEKLYLNICMYMYTVTHFKLILKTGNDWIKSIFNCKKMVSKKLKNIFLWRIQYSATIHNFHFTEDKRPSFLFSVLTFTREASTYPSMERFRVYAPETSGSF